MNFLTLLLPLFSNIIEKIFPDPVKAAEAQAEMRKLINEAQIEASKAEAIKDTNKKEIITAEINQGGTGSWRANLMMICIYIVGFDWIVAPTLNAFLAPLGYPIMALPVPTELWTLVTVGLGGYLGKESISNYTANKYAAPNDKAFFDKLRKDIFIHGMTDKQVDSLNEALAERERGQ